MSGAALIELARAHAPIFILVAPWLGAAAASLAPWPRLAWAVAALAAAAMFAAALDLAWRALLLGARTPAPAEALPLALDGASLFALAVVAGAAFFCALAGAANFRGAEKPLAPLHYALSLCVAGGWAGALLAQDLTALAASVAAAWCASVALTALGAERDRGALGGALRMLSAGGIALALLFLGAAMTARGIGSLDLAAIESVRIAAPGLAAAGLGLMVLALAVMAGAAPLHLWLAASLGRAHPFAALTLGAVALVGAMAALVRLGAHALGAPSLAEGMAWALASLGMIGIAVGSLQAAGARSLPRLAAYAAVAQTGCLLVCLALGSLAGIAAALVQLAATAAASVALLAAAEVSGVRALAHLDGLARRAPLAGAAIMAGALGLMGAPLTLGFLARWRLIEAAVGAGWWWAACGAIAASLAGVFYGGRLIERVYFRRATTAMADAPRGANIEAAPALIAAIALTAVGVEPTLLLRAAHAAAALMTGAAP